MANPAQVSDLVARWRPLSASETVVAQAYLDDAWFAILLPRRPTLEADMSAGTVSTEAVVFVVTQMVLRVLRNPEGKVEETIDDYRYRRDVAVAGGTLYASPAELAMLLPRSADSSRRSVRLVIYGDS